MARAERGADVSDLPETPLAGPSAIRLLPPMIVGEREIEEAVRKLHAAF
jgi:acetylornithine/succinyldiaminopimelate/putrescine aminotransferase